MGHHKTTYKLTMLAAVLFFLTQGLTGQQPKTNVITFEDGFKVELPSGRAKKLTVDFEEEEGFVARYYAHNGAYTVYEHLIQFESLKGKASHSIDFDEEAKVVKTTFFHINVNGEEYAYIFLLFEDSTLKYYVANKETETVFTAKLHFPKLVVSENTIFEIEPYKENGLYLLHLKNEYYEERWLETNLYNDIINLNKSRNINLDIKSVEEFDDNSISKCSIYLYNSFTENIVSRDPFWHYFLPNVSCHQIVDYKNRKNETVPLLFVAYENGSAGFFILPINSEKEMLYYEFKGKYKANKDKCLLFEGIDEYKNKNVFYFRIVQPDGETVNYGIPEGMF